MSSGNGTIDHDVKAPTPDAHKTSVGCQDSTRRNLPGEFLAWEGRTDVNVGQSIPSSQRGVSNPWREEVSQCTAVSEGSILPGSELYLFC